jgi:predicted metal-dependent phosphoesterase TrpH
MQNKFKFRTIEKFAHLGKADFHIHSNYSDGKPGIEEIIQYVEEKTDLDIIAITDHDTIEGAVRAREIVENGKYRFDLIVGEEISTTNGHILGLFLSEKIEPGQSVEATIREIHRQSGIAIATHPFIHVKYDHEKMYTMDGIGAGKLYENRFILDGVEIVNATPTLTDENLGATAMNRTLLRLTETGSSDAHILEAIGKGYTVFQGKTAEDLKEAIKKHQTQAIYGHWTLLALIKYLYFFIPIGARILWSQVFNRKLKY